MTRTVQRILAAVALLLAAVVIMAASAPAPHSTARPAAVTSAPATAAPDTVPPAAPCCQPVKVIYYDAHGYGTPPSGAHTSRNYSFPAGSSYYLSVGPNCDSTHATEYRTFDFWDAGNGGVDNWFLARDVYAGHHTTVTLTAAHRGYYSTQPVPYYETDCYFHVQVYRWENPNTAPRKVSK